MKDSVDTFQPFTTTLDSFRFGTVAPILIGVVVPGTNAARVASSSNAAQTTKTKH